VTKLTPEIKPHSCC